MIIADENGFRKLMIGAAQFLAWQVSHIEAHLSAAGIPDLCIGPTSIPWRCPKPDLWLELKVIKDGQIKLRPTQKRWHRERNEVGGRSWVAVLDRQTGDILTVPGHVAAGLDSRAASWRAVAAVSNIQDTLEDYLVKLNARNVSHEERSPNRNGASQDARTPAPALPAGGENVGGHHWLADKP